MVHRCMIKTCKLCGATSEAASFYEGVASRCAECHRKKVRENRTEKAQYYRDYDKMRFQRDVHRRIANKAYALTERGKEVHKRATAKFKTMCPEKRAAHVLLNNAVRDGRVIKPKNCSRCGEIPKRRDLHGHHNDYALPLVVEWVCVVCHAKEHWPKEDWAS